MPNFNCDPNADTAGLVDLSYGWASCTSIESFPPKDFSSGLNFNYTWANCSSMATISTLYLYNQLRDATEFVQTWEGCSSLTSFGALDLSSATVFDRTWKDCSSLTSFPFIFVNSGTTFTNTWEGCTSLETFPPNMFNACSASNYAGAWFGCALSPQSIENILVSLDTSGVVNGTCSVAGGTNACFGEWTALATAAYDNLFDKSWTIQYNDCPPPPVSPITVELRPEGPSPYALPLTDYTIVDIVMPEGSDPLIAGQYNLFTLTLTPLNGTLGLDYFLPMNPGYVFLDLSYTGANPGAWISPPWGPQGAVIWSPIRIGNGPDYVFVCAAQNISLNTIPAGSTLGKMYVHTPPVCSEGVSTGASWEISISQTTQQELDASYAIGQTLSPFYPPFELRPAVIGTTDVTSGYTVDGERLTFPFSDPAYSSPECLPPSSAAVLNWGSVYGPGGVFYRTRIYIEDSSYYNDASYLDLDYSGPEPVSVQPYLDPPFENNGWSILSAPVAYYGPVIYATVVGVQLIRVWAGPDPGGVLVWSDTPQPPSPPVAIQQTIYIRSILETIDGNLLTGEVNTPGPNPTLPVVSVPPVVGAGGPSNQIFELISDSIGSYGIFTLSSNGDFEYIVDLTNPIVLNLSPYTPPYYTGVSEPFQFRVTDLAGNTSEGVVNVSIQASYTRIAAAFTYDPIPPVPPNQGRKMWHLNEPLISTLSNPNYSFFGLNYPWTGPVTDPPPYITGYTDQPGNWLIGGPPPSGFFD